MASWTQGLADFVDAHVRAFQNDRRRACAAGARQHQAAVIKGLSLRSADQPQLCRHGGALTARRFFHQAEAPARTRQGRAGVLMVERWLLGRMRHRIFYGWPKSMWQSANWLQRLNEERPIRRLGVTRRQLLEQIDRPALKGLPADPYVLAEWRIRPCRHRTISRSRRPLLQRPPPLRPAPRWRCASPCARWRSFLKGRAHCRPSTHERQSQAHHHCRAQCPPAIAAMPAGPSRASARCSRIGPGDGGTVRSDLRGAFPPRTGLPQPACIVRLAVYGADGWKLPRRTPAASARALRLVQIHPRPILIGLAPTRPAEATDPARQTSADHANTLGETILLTLHPRSSCTLSAFTAWPRPSSMSKPQARPKRSPMRMARPSARTRSSMRHAGGWPRGCVTPTAPAGLCGGRRLQSAARPRPQPVP